MVASDFRVGTTALRLGAMIYFISCFCLRQPTVLMLLLTGYLSRHLAPFVCSLDKLRLLHLLRTPGIDSCHVFSANIWAVLCSVETVLIVRLTCSGRADTLEFCWQQDCILITGIAIKHGTRYVLQPLWPSLSGTLEQYVKALISGCTWEILPV